MTLVNWISISIVVVIFIVGCVLCVYYVKKLRNLDGYMGIISPKAERDKQDIEKRNSKDAF